MKIPVKNLQNQAVAEVELPDELFAYPFKEHLVHEVVQAHLAGLRSGTHKTKTRSEVSGSGRKLWKQKGTGRARIGSIRSPLWRKGGTVHGPVPRSYAKDISAREKKNALKSVLSRKLRDQQLVVVDSLELGSHRTKEFASALTRLGIAGKALLVDRFDNSALGLASRNLQDVKVVDALGVNVYDVVDRSFVVVSQQALGRLAEVLAS